jgi:hypothetical protein
MTWLRASLPLLKTTLVALVVVWGSERAARAEGAPAEFIQDAKVLYRVVACAGNDPLPEHIDASTVEAHCKWMVPHIEKYRQAYAGEASAFIAKLRPSSLPQQVVYPFGGGDLLSALTTYPEAKELTTISLEHAGDPRRIRTLKKAGLDASLQVIRKTIVGLIEYDDSRTDNLMKGQRLEIPGQLAFFLVALAVHGYEPTSLRYFRLDADGKVHYMSEADIAAVESKNARLLHAGWVSPDFSEAFSNLELTFVKKDGPDKAPRMHRHIAFNLDDDHLKGDPSLLKHLESKGHVVAMTKAASYLLWRQSFSLIRNYLLAHMEFMISDSTGIPPEYAKKAGFVQETYGKFESSFLNANSGINKDFRNLWKTSPEKPLPFRYGYIDKANHYHMLITKRDQPAQSQKQ